MITSEQAMLLVGALLGSVRQHVTDMNVLNSINAEFNRITETTNQHRQQFDNLPFDFDEKAT